MRLRFWLGFAVVAAIAVGSIAVALVVHERESDSFERRSSGEARAPRTRPKRCRALGRPALQRLGLLPGGGPASPPRVRRGRRLAAATRGAHRDSLHRPVPAHSGRSFERGHGFPILERGRSALRRAGGAADYFPLIYVAASGRPCSRRSATTSAPTACAAPTCCGARQRQAAATPAMRAAGRRHRDQRLPTGLPRRRADPDVAERRAALTGFAAGSFRSPTYRGGDRRSRPTG